MSSDSTPLKKVPHVQSAQNRLLIKGGDVINANGTKRADVYIEDKVIKAVGRNLDGIPGGTCTIDVTGKLVIPGGIDTHTHLQMLFMGTKSVDDFYIGTKAIAGGTTMVIDFVIPQKRINSGAIGQIKRFAATTAFTW